MRRTATVRLDRPITEAAELAHRAEDLGFDGVWVADHYFHRDATGALALMATATSRITMGTAVVSPLLRHPALLASSAASLAEISDGRFILGLGAGGYEFASELGIRSRRPLGLTAEAVEIVRGVFAGRADVEGETFSAHGAALRFEPRATPVYLAARGPKMLGLAGRVADGVITHGLSSRHVSYVIDRMGVAEADRRPAVVLMLDVQIDEDQARARDALRPRCMTMAAWFVRRRAHRRVRARQPAPWPGCAPRCARATAPPRRASSPTRWSTPSASPGPRDTSATGWRNWPPRAWTR